MGRGGTGRDGEGRSRVREGRRIGGELRLTWRRNVGRLAANWRRNVGGSGRFAVNPHLVVPPIRGGISAGVGPPRGALVVPPSAQLDEADDTHLVPLDQPRCLDLSEPPGYGALRRHPDEGHAEGRHDPRFALQPALVVGLSDQTIEEQLRLYTKPATP